MEGMGHVHSHGGGEAAALMSEPADMRTDCSGTVIDGLHFGSWKGHVLPGALLIIWGSWWAYNVCARYLASRRSPAPYRASPWFPMAAKWARYLEPALKLILPPIAVSVELYWDHDAYRYLYCPEGTKLAGRFAATHMNNWQHTSSYPAFVLSGLVDFLGMCVHLPAGLSQAFLALAFSAEAFLMALHKKHLPLDEVVHWLLYVTMLLCVAFILLEIRFPHSVLLGAGKSASLVFQGAWLVQTAKIMMEHRPEWTMEYMGSTMMAPVVFTMIGVLVATCFLGLYVLLYVLSEKGLLWQPAYTPLETQEAQQGDESFDDDSAQHSGADSPMVGKTGKLSPFHIAHGHQV